MHVKHLNITHAYHFLSEGIILYLLVLPFMFYYYETVPNWIYLSLLTGICLVFSLYSKLYRSHLPYILSIPIMILVFYGIGYPLSLSIVFSGLLAWRYISIRSKVFLGYESNYLVITFLLIFLGLLVMRDLHIIFFLIAQLFVVIIGYILSNLTVIERAERKAFNRTVWLKFVAIISIITFLFYYLFSTATNVVKEVWGFLGDILHFMISLIAELFNMIRLNLFVENNQNTEDQIGSGGQGQEAISNHEYTGGAFDFFLYLSIAVLILFFIFLIYRAMKSKFREVEQDNLAGYSKVEERLDAKKHPRKRRLLRKRVLVDHPVRKMIYQFERKAANHHKGRKHHESIEEWFTRIGIEGNIEVYQKVRYGENTISEEEIRSFKESLNKLEEQLVIPHPQHLPDLFDQ